jgi:hypothetical protein
MRIPREMLHRVPSEVHAARFFDCVTVSTTTTSKGGVGARKETRALIVLARCRDPLRYRFLIGAHICLRIRGFGGLNIVVN